MFLLDVCCRFGVSHGFVHKSAAFFCYVVFALGGGRVGCVFVDILGSVLCIHFGPVGSAFLQFGWLYF